MAKVIVIEEAVDVGAEQAARLIDGAVRNVFRCPLTHDVGKRTGAGFINGLTDVNLVTVETGFSARSAAK